MKRLYIYTVAVICNGHPPNRKKCPFGCNGYLTAVSAGQSQQFYSGVGIFYNWRYRRPPPGSKIPGGVQLEITPKLICILIYRYCGECNQAKPRRANLAELKLPPLGQIPLARAAHLLAQSGYFLRLRSLGVTVLIRKIVHPGKIPVFPLVVLTF
jgi:hypothetical protein